MNILKIPARLEDLNKALNIVELYLTSIGCSFQTMSKVCMCIEEIVTNICLYAYGDRDGMIEISYDMVTRNTEKFVRITLKDSGSFFNPLEKKDPDLQIPFMERPIGGLGIYLVKQIMDDIKYTRDHGMNVLIMEKKI